MPTINLSTRYVYDGVFYGPGEATVPNDDVAKALKEREDAAKNAPPSLNDQVLSQAINLAERDRQAKGARTTAAASSAATLPPPSAAGAPTESQGPSTNSEESSKLSASAEKALVDAGYDSAEKIAAASDEELLAIDGIGPASLRTLREAQARPQAPTA